MSIRCNTRRVVRMLTLTRGHQLSLDNLQQLRRDTCQRYANDSDAAVVLSHYGYNADN